jgi:hypothetical protein
MANPMIIGVLFSSSLCLISIVAFLIYWFFIKKSCPDGEKWDKTEKKCVSSCSTGEKWDKTEKKCVTDSTTTPPEPTTVTPSQFRDCTPDANGDCGPYILKDGSKCMTLDTTTTQLTKADCDKDDVKQKFYYNKTQGGTLYIKPDSNKYCLNCCGGGRASGPWNWRNRGTECAVHPTTIFEMTDEGKIKGIGTDNRCYDTSNTTGYANKCDTGGEKYTIQQY